MSVKRTREKACELAALVLSGRPNEAALLPIGWSLAVFFERYIDGGAEATRKEFGPRKPRKLKVTK